MRYSALFLDIIGVYLCFVKLDIFDDGVEYKDKSAWRMAHILAVSNSITLSRTGGQITPNERK